MFVGPKLSFCVGKCGGVDVDERVCIHGFGVAEKGVETLLTLGMAVLINGRMVLEIVFLKERAFWFRARVFSVAMSRGVILIFLLK
jgi:hypothetical protein